MLLSASGMSPVQWKAHRHAWFISDVHLAVRTCPVGRHGEGRGQGVVQAEGANTKNKQGRRFLIHYSLSLGIIQAGTSWMGFCWGCCRGDSGLLREVD